MKGVRFVEVIARSKAEIRLLEGSGGTSRGTLATGLKAEIRTSVRVVV